MLFLTSPQKMQKRGREMVSSSKNSVASRNSRHNTAVGLPLPYITLWKSWNAKNYYYHYRLEAPALAIRSKAFR